jgi:hypothetical protein
MEGLAMRRHRLLIVSTVFAIGTAASAAEPVKPEARDTTQPTVRPAAIVLASADRLQPATPAAQEQGAVPVKRPRAARVTTCRCGGQDQSVER